MKTFNDQDYLFEVPVYHKIGTPIFGSTFKIGDPVYLKDLNSIGFIINGPINEYQYQEWKDEVKTDSHGNRSLSNLEMLNPSQHLDVQGVENIYKNNSKIMYYFLQI